MPRPSRGKTEIFFGLVDRHGYARNRTMNVAAFKLAGRFVLLAAIVAGIVLAWLHRDALSPSAIEASLSHSAWAPALYLLAHIVASLLFIPRTLVAAAAGLMFGLWWGLVWATIGSVLGSAAGFLVARYINSGMIRLEALPRLGPYFVRAERGGWPVVALIRILPIMNHSFANYALGLTKVSFGAYMIGSFLGQIPSTVAFVEFGAAGERLAGGKAGWLWPMLIGLAALAFAFALRRVFQRQSPPA
jgi:uncharacterized membrane protein YdjX (TVP38/TMEM64 family)